MPRLAETVRLNTPWNTENTSVVAPPMSTPTTASRSRFATFSMMIPTAPGVGMIGTGLQAISLRYPGAWAMTCSMNSSWIASRAGFKFSRSSVGRRLGTTSKAVRPPIRSRTIAAASRLPA